MQEIITSDKSTLPELFRDSFFIPSAQSHKGQNGKVLIIGGSDLFHAAPLWSAEVMSHFADLVHFASTIDNNKLFISLKKKFRNGMIIDRKEISFYIAEDDSVLIGPGMVRVGKEATYTAEITEKLLKEFPKKRFVLDAGALQTMDPQWLLNRETPVILTPHQQEFEKLFSIQITEKSEEEKIQIVTETAQKYRCIILLKAIVDIVSDGSITYIIRGGNQGLTKGGSGDALAGLCTAFYAKNEPLIAACLSSYFIKKAADELSIKEGYWYNTEELIAKIPHLVKDFAL